jgi:hypothetical protein
MVLGRLLRNHTIDRENGDTKETGEECVSEDVEEETAGAVFDIIIDDCRRNDGAKFGEST